MVLILNTNHINLVFFSLEIQYPFVFLLSPLLKLLFAHITLYLNPSIPRGNISDVTRYSNLMNFSVFDFLWRPQMHTVCNTKNF